MRLLAILAVTFLSSCATAPGAAQHRNEQNSPNADGYAHYLAGVIHQRNGRYEEAAEEYRKAADLLPDSTTLNIRLIQFYIEDQDFANAEVMCRRVLEKVKDDPSLWIILATVCQRQEKYEEAARAIESAIASNPESLEDFSALLAAGEMAKDKITTIDLLTKLHELNPNSPEILFRLAFSYFSISDDEKARDALNKAIGLDPGFSQAKRLLGVIAHRMGDFDTAVREFDALVKEEADDELRGFLAGSLACAKDYTRAADEIGIVVDGGEANAEDYLARIYLLLRSGQPAEAAKVVPPSGAPILGTVFRAIARKQAGEPFAPLLESLDQADSDVDVECSDVLALLLFRYGNDDSGTYLISQLDDLRSAGVHSKNLDIMQARTCMYLDRDEDAAKILEDAVERYGSDKILHMHLGTVYDKLDRFRDAERHLKTCLELDPTDPETMNNLGYIYAENDTKLEEAEKLIKRALELDPKNGYYLDSLGWVYYRRGKGDLAVQKIREAIVSMEEDDAILRDHLGDAYLLSGDVRRAIGEWERARRLDPKIEGVDQKIEKHRSKLGT